MKNISTEWGFGAYDDIFTNYDNVKDEINYINTLEDEVFMEKSNSGKFKAELLKRGIMIKGFVQGDNEYDKSISRLISICRFTNFNEKYCFKMAKEMKISYDNFLSIAFEEKRAEDNDLQKINDYFKRNEVSL